MTTIEHGILKATLPTPAPPALDSFQKRYTDLCIEHRKKLAVEIQRMLDLWDKRDGEPVILWRRFGDVVSREGLDAKGLENHAAYADHFMLWGLGSDCFPDPNKAFVQANGLWTYSPVVKLVCDGEPVEDGFLSYPHNMYGGMPKGSKP